MHDKELWIMPSCRELLLEFLWIASKYEQLSLNGKFQNQCSLQTVVGVFVVCTCWKDRMTTNHLNLLNLFSIVQNFI